MAKISSLPVSENIYDAQAGFVPAESAVFHGFFTRRGGVSGGIYASLNCGIGSSDDREHVHQNRAIVARVAGTAPEKLLTLYQVHGDTCLTVTAPWPQAERPQADAFVTDRAGLALGILTADCAPVLFYGKKPDGAPVVGAAHAGWKGALGGILESALAGLEALGAQPETIRACIGPCIGRRSYEVTAEFVTSFVKANPAYEDFFRSANQSGHMLFDLAGFCASRLQMAGLKHVSIQDKDTYAQAGDYFSYRRKTHRNEPDYGRQISVIMIKDQE